MYLPRDSISRLYLELLHSRHPLLPPVLILVSLDPDALCACRILTSLFKNDYIPHTIKPVSGYADLAKAGAELVQPMRTTEGGGGGVVVCLGVGGLVDLESILGLEVDDDGTGGMGGVCVWVLDSRRPWNLSNVFGVQGRHPDSQASCSKIHGLDRGKILPSFSSSAGGIIVFDDGDIEEELMAEQDAYCSLADMPHLDEHVSDSDDSESEDDHTDQQAPDDGIPDSAQLPLSYAQDGDAHRTGEKRKMSSSPQSNVDEPIDTNQGVFGKRRRTSSSPSSSSLPSSSRQKHRSSLIPSGVISTGMSMCGISPKQPSARQLRKRLLTLRREHDDILEQYYSLGTSYAEPISSLMWNLASELGREDNDLLWQAIVGVSSIQLSGKTSSGIGISPLSTSGHSSSWNRDRGERIRSIFRDEARRLNPLQLKDLAREVGGDLGMIPTHASSPNDTSIRLSPEPRLLLVRHWSLYDSMLHSPYLSAKLHVWSDTGRRKLHKLLAKMGVSLNQCKQSYTHMDIQLKRSLRKKLLHFAPQYGLQGLLPPESRHNDKEGWGFVRCWGWKACLSALDAGVIITAILEVGDIDSTLYTSQIPTPVLRPSHLAVANSSSHSPETSVRLLADATASSEESMLKRFWIAYDALTDITKLTSNIPIAQHLHRAILRTGTSLIEKRQIRHLRAFRIAVVKEGPDVSLFTHPGALIKLGLWLAEAISELDSLKGHNTSELVMASLDEARGLYIVIGLGGGSTITAQKAKEAKKADARKSKIARCAQLKAAREQKRQLSRQRLEALGEDLSGLEDDDNASETDMSSSSSEDYDSDDSDDSTTPATNGKPYKFSNKQKRRGSGFNRFGNAFQEVVEETGVRVKIDSFEHCAVEIRKEDLSAFLEALCMKTVVG